MELRPLGRSGLLVSRLALGTMTWGRDTDRHEARDQLLAFVEAGGTLVDTADVYADGQSEEIVGTLVEEVGRDALVIATKAVSRPGTERRLDASRGHLLSALDASLVRLGVDHVDLWQLHAWDPVTPLEETLSAIDLAVASGKVRYAGISNYSGWQTAKAAGAQRAKPAAAPLVSTQVEYSLLERGIEREVVCTAAEGLGVAPLEVALAWVRDRPGVVAPIVGARTAAQLRGALTVEELTLPEEIVYALDEVSAPARGYPETAGSRR